MVTATMPIYEFRCNGCKKRLSVFQRRMGTAAGAVCPRCGSADLTRLVSRVAVVRSEEERLESLDDDSLLAGVDEEDPRSVAAWARKLKTRMGEEADADFDEMIDRMEAGEMPDDGEASDDDLDL
jgi:putative FmdB family regulatory protein